FDASIFELWGSLLNGGKLVAIRERRATMEELGRQIRGNGITVMWLTAGLFHQMVRQAPEILKGVKQMLAGGDVLRVEEVERALGELGEGKLINGYGPTEATTFACSYEMNAGKSMLNGNVPIGRPINNTEVYVLDNEKRVAPVGMIGELYISGDGLAR